ncbi:hypothetical protein ACA910_009597 [Epithemia clementina (nom. ined.)]
MTIDATTTNEQPIDDNNVEITLTDDEAFALLYRIFCFLVCLYVLGDLLCGKGLKIVPALVGQVVVGLVFGPHGANWLDTTNSTNTDAPLLLLSMAGELGLILMLCQAGSQMDLPLLQRTGLRSVIMAVTGSLLPTALGFVLSYFVVLEERGDWKGALSVGCSFGPTSAGIALAVLEQCHVLSTPVGQLVVAVAIVDDILALVVLSQLRALTETSSGGGGVTPVQIIIPIVSAFLWLSIGAFVALRVIPKVLEKMQVLEKKLLLTGGGSCTSESHAVEDDHHNNTDEPPVPLDAQEGTPSDETPSSNLSGVEDTRIEEIHETERGSSSSSAAATTTTTSGKDKNDSKTEEKSFSIPIYYATSLLILLLPATYYTEASYFLGAFLSGLCLATHATAAQDLTRHWNDVTGWLMRLFFGATIAFRIPVNLWWEQPQTLAWGGLLALSLLGKLAVGPLLTPVLDDGGQAWDAAHVRDCLITGCSMAGEAEFAFVVAAFGLDQGLISESVYASVTFAILLSTVISPVLLRVVLTYTANPKPAI